MPVLTSPPSSPPAGLKESIEAAGHSVSAAPEGWLVDNVAAVQAIISTYTGSVAELTYWRAQQQKALDTLFNANFDLAKFIRAGTVTTVTGVQVGNFIAQITNNYRSIKASIAAAANVAAVQAININAGWPSNP